MTACGAYARVRYGCDNGWPVYRGVRGLVRGAALEVCAVSNIWISSQDIADRTRHLFGGTIDLDPASDATANEVVRATRFITEEENALSENTIWFPNKPGSVFLNPPGGKSNADGTYAKYGRYSRTGQFWGRGLSERAAKRLTHAVFVAFNIGALQTTQAYGDMPMLHLPICVPRARLAFIDRERPDAKQPRLANALIYIPGTVDKREVFAEVFGPLGAVRL